MLAAPACRPDDTGESDDPLEVTVTALGPLSYRLEFSTEAPTRATALWWEGEEEQPPARYAWVEDGEDADEQHDLHVFGLRPGLSYQALVRVESDDGRTASSAPFTLTTQEILPLPAHAPDDFADIALRTRVFCPRPDLIDPGSVLATNLAISADAQLSQVVIWDRRGHPVWTHFTTDETRAGSGDVDVRLVGEGAEDYRSDNASRALLVGGGIPADTRTAVVGLDHRVQQEGPVQGAFIGEEGFMHHCASLVDGVFVTLSTTLTEEGPSDWLVLHDGTFDPLVNADPRQGVLWDLVTLDALRVGYFSNSLEWDPQAGLVYYYAKPEGILFALDQRTRRTVWAFGPGVPHHSFSPEALLIGSVEDVAGCGEVWFTGAHHVTVDRVEGDRDSQVRVLAHDNGTRGVGAEPRDYTRAVEYRLDLDTGTAELLWCYPRGEPEADALEPLWYQVGIWGDIERAGDHVIFYSGEPWDEGTGIPTVSVIHELVPDYETHRATLAWRMILEADDGQAEKIVPGFYSGQAIPGLWGQAGGADLDFHRDREEEPVLSSWSNAVAGGW